MKSKLLQWMAVFSLFAALVIPAWLGAQEQTNTNKQPTRYTVTDLGSTQSFAEGINNRSSVALTKFLADGVTQHAVLWRNGITTDLGTLGGPNSSAFQRPSERDQVAGNAETSQPDPLGEDFCTYGTHLICLAFVWRNGAMSPLPTLGGNNSWANGGINNRGQVVGLAENTTLDQTCAVPSLEAKPVIWEGDSIRELPTVSTDEDGTALAINDQGQAVGTSTDCGAAPTIFHAVLWLKDGSVIDLGNFGGAMNNIAQGINNVGQVVGYSDLPGDTSSHAFLWTARDGMQDIGVGDGLFSSLAFGINDKGQVVGMSCDENFDCGAFLWQDGVMTDLNTLVPNGSPWNVIVGTSINSRGEIVGVGDTGNGFHAILLIPCDKEHADVAGCNNAGKTIPQGEAAQRHRVSLPENIRKLLWKRPGVRPSSTTSTVQLIPSTMRFICDLHVSWGCQLKNEMRTATLTNTGNNNLVISSIKITAFNFAFSETNNCPPNLSPGQSCIITVKYHIGVISSSGHVYVNDNAIGSPQTISLSGYTF